MITPYKLRSTDFVYLGTIICFECETSAFELFQQVEEDFFWVQFIEFEQEQFRNRESKKQRERNLSHTISGGVRLTVPAVSKDYDVRLFYDVS